MRKLATIRMIGDIKPIEGADRIEVAKVDGWEVVISKKDNFKVGDLIVYIEIDSQMPKKPEYEFLASRKYVVKTIVMRGQISQGLVLPLAVLPEGNYKLGDDVTEILGITKYDPQLEEENEIANFEKKKAKNPIVKYLLRYAWFRKLYLKSSAKTDFPSWIRKTDEERIQNCTRLFERMKRDKIKLSVTEKIDGCSATYYLKRISKRRFEFGVCSRNRRLATPDSSYYWKIARQYNIEEVLKRLIGDGEYIILQGEITGEGIQGNKYKVKGYSFWAYNLITTEKKYTTDEMQPVLVKHGIYTVPIVTLEYNVPETISDMVEYVKGNSQIVQREREGCVFRNVKENISFKCINPNFLLAEG